MGIRIERGITLNKRILVILLAVGLAVTSGTLYLVMNADPSQLPAGWAWYRGNAYSVGYPEDWDVTNVTEPYSIGYPEDWNVPYVTGNIALFEAPAGMANFSTTIGNPYGLGEDLEGAVTIYKESLENFIGAENLVFLTEGTISTQQNGYQIIYRQTSSEPPYKHGVNIIYRALKTYSLTWGAPENSYDSYAEIFDTALNSFTTWSILD